MLRAVAAVAALGCLVAAPRGFAAAMPPHSSFLYDHATVEVIADPDQRLLAFGADARRVGLAGRLSGCAILLKQPPRAPGGNAVYAAVCTLSGDGARRPVEVCDADGSNAFVVRNLPAPQITRGQLAAFMQICAG